VAEIGEILSIDVGIASMIMDNFPMRDREDNNGIWAETFQIMRLKLLLDRDLQIYEFGSGRTNMSPNMPRFLQKIEHRDGENAEVLHDHLKRRD
jgi:hypothetical protein